MRYIPTCSVCAGDIYLRVSGEWAHIAAFNPEPPHAAQPGSDDAFVRHLLAPAYLHAEANRTIHDEMPAHPHTGGHNPVLYGGYPPLVASLAVVEDASFVHMRSARRTYEPMEGGTFTFEVSIEAPTEEEIETELLRLHDDPDELADIAYLSLFGSVPHHPSNGKEVEGDDESHR